MRVSLKTLSIILLLLIAFGVISEGVLIEQDDIRHADAIVVIGGDHKPERISRAAELYHSGFAPIVIISAGTKVKEGGEWLHESEVMRRQAIANALPDSVIIIESQSMSTFENAYYSEIVFRPYGIHSILLVTSAFHSRRAKRIFQDILEPGIHVNVQPARLDSCPLCWLFDLSQVYTVFYEYWNWGRYYLTIK